LIGILKRLKRELEQLFEEIFELLLIKSELSS